MCVFVLAVKIAALAVGLAALLITFKARLIVEKLTKKEPEEGMVLRVKCIALGLAVIDFLTVFILVR